MKNSSVHADLYVANV